MWPEAGSRPEGSDDEDMADEASCWRPDVEGSDAEATVTKKKVMKAATRAKKMVMKAVG